MHHLIKKKLRKLYIIMVYTISYTISNTNMTERKDQP